MPALCLLRSRAHPLNVVQNMVKKPCTAEEAYEKYRCSFPWLRLYPAGQGQETGSLGCDICAKHDTDRIKNGLAAGVFRPGKYLYARTFREHERESQIHVAATQREAAGEEKLEMDPLEIDKVEPCTPDKGSNSVSDGAPTPPKRPRADTRAMFFNVLFAAYQTIHHGWSFAVFKGLLLFARVAQAAVPEAHDSAVILSECRQIIFAEARRTRKQNKPDVKKFFFGAILEYLFLGTSTLQVKQGLKQDLLTAEGYGISLDAAWHYYTVNTQKAVHVQHQVPLSLQCC